MPPTAIYELARRFSTEEGKSVEQMGDLLFVLEMLEEIVTVTDPNGVVLYVNSAAEHITGYRIREIVGKTPALWGHQMDDGFYQTLWRTIAEQKEQYRGTVRNKKKNGVMYDAALHITPVLNTDGSVRFFLGVERDISEAQQLIRSQREFISLASHNLKTPLASMRWYAEMMLDGDVGKLSKSQKEYVEEILNAAKRMVALIQQWLTISRIDIGQYAFHNETVSVDGVIGSVLEDMRARIEGRQISVHFQTNTSPCIMVADRDVLKTIVHTLVLNAIKYNREKGTLSIHAAILPAHHEFAGKTFDNTRVTIEVVDTGIGIPAEEQGGVFQQFFRASNVEQMQSEGAGLGLFLTYSLVTMLHGDIWFSSSEEGSKFYVALPTDAVVSDTQDTSEEHV